MDANRFDALVKTLSLGVANASPRRMARRARAEAVRVAPASRETRPRHAPTNHARSRPSARSKISMPAAERWSRRSSKTSRPVNQSVKMSIAPCAKSVWSRSPRRGCPRPRRASPRVAVSACNRSGWSASRAVSAQLGRPRRRGSLARAKGPVVLQPTRLARKMRHTNPSSVRPRQLSGPRSQVQAAPSPMPFV
jgi:hypothetical protein